MEIVGKYERGKGGYEVADVDWEKIRLSYVRGRLKSYQAIAKKYKISLDTVEKRARREGWYKERREYLASVHQKAKARAKESDSRRLAALQDAGTKMCDQLEAIMQDAELELHSHVDSAGKTVRAEVINDKKLYNLSRSIETMTRAMRNLYDIRTGAEQAQLEIARQEMALKEREQDRKEKADGDKGPQEIKITYEGVDNMEAYHE